jgi:hypothetical protein
MGLIQMNRTGIDIAWYLHILKMSIMLELENRDHYHHTAKQILRKDTKVQKNK